MFSLTYSVISGCFPLFWILLIKLLCDKETGLSYYYYYSTLIRVQRIAKYFVLDNNWLNIEYKKHLHVNHKTLYLYHRKCVCVYKLAKGLKLWNRPILCFNSSSTAHSKMCECNKKPRDGLNLHFFRSAISALFQWNNDGANQLVFF